MASCLDTYFIVVLEDATTSRIIGAATLFIELKFIHQCSKVAVNLLDMFSAWSY